MKIAPDTNILVRILTNDDPAQAEIGRRCLAEADAIMLSTPALCEAAWVLKRFFGASRDEIGVAIRALVGAHNAVFDTTAVTAGLNILDAGGDFADGVIAASGVAMGADAFVSFDKKAVRLLSDAGLSTRLL